MNTLRFHFYPYQWSWLQDPSPLKLGLWARQTGKDFTCAAEAVFECLSHPNSDWLIIACGERQAVESLEKAKHWAHLANVFVSEHTHMTPPPTSVKARELRFPNGSRITALPAKPETLRGYSANLILTEFAFHSHPDDIWRAVFPIITNPLRGGRKKLRIISTPNGQSNLFHKLWLNPDFSKHKVTIHDAIAQGLPIKLDLLRRGLADNESFAQEYECQFLDLTSILLPYDLIQSCESPDATESSTPQILSTCGRDFYLGIDFARKHDLTVAWLLEKVSGSASLSAPRGEGQGEGCSDESCSNPQSAFRNPHSTHIPQYITREVLVLENLPTPDQLTHLRPRVARARRVCLDYTGAGIGLGDLLASEFGSSNPQSGGGATLPRSHFQFSHNMHRHSGRIDLCSFTPTLKNELFPNLRAAFERGIIAIPSCSAIREDLHGVHKVVSPNGQITYRATHTSDGHSDRCTALALALRAAQSTPPSACATSVELPAHLRPRR